MQNLPLISAFYRHLGHTPTFKMLIKFEFAPPPPAPPEDQMQQAPAPAPLYLTSSPANFRGTWGGPILLDDIYGGETYDARLEFNAVDPEWNPPVDPLWAPVPPLPDPVVAVAFK